MIAKTVLFRLLMAGAAALSALLVVGFTCAQPEASAVFIRPLDEWGASTVVDNVAATAFVSVTNTSDLIDGDTTSIAALLGNPGPDGISFREALNAANGTPGPKQIDFAPALAGGRIIFAPKGDLLTLASGDLTIDGDIDHDGQQDITLDGSAGVAGPATLGLVIDSSHNTITGLALQDFVGSAILMSCLHEGCAPKTFSDNRIISNTVSTGRGTAALIGLGVAGLRPVEDLAAMSDVLWQDIVIAGNTLTNTTPGTLGVLGINASLGGASRNRVSGLTITGNHMAGGWLGIVVSGMSSDAFGVPGPPHYGDDNVIEHVTVADNVINQGTNGSGSAIYLNAAAGGGTRNILSDVVISHNRLLPEIYNGLDVIAADVNSGYFGAPGANKYTDGNRIQDLLILDNSIEAPGGIGMNIAAANFGNRDNELLRVKIIGNTVSHCLWAGIDVAAGNGGFGGQSYGDQSARDNRVTGLEVRDNHISDCWRAIWLKGGLGGRNPLVPVDANRIDGATLAGNRITDFSDIGIALVGGSANDSSAASNSLNDVVITGNHIEQVKRLNEGIAVQVLGGSGPAVAAKDNLVTGMTLTGNEIIGAGTGVQVLGGSGAGAQGNTARVLCPAGNRLVDVPTPWDVRNDSDGARGNLAQVTWCSYLPLMQRQRRLVVLATANIR